MCLEFIFVVTFIWVRCGLFCLEVLDEQGSPSCSQEHAVSVLVRKIAQLDAQRLNLRYQLSMLLGIGLETLFNCRSSSDVVESCCLSWLSWLQERRSKMKSTRKRRKKKKREKKVTMRFLQPSVVEVTGEAGVTLQSASSSNCGNYTSPRLSNVTYLILDISLHACSSTHKCQIL